MSIFDDVKRLHQDRIANALGLRLAGDRKSYVCPECGNGSNRGKGDGLVWRENGTARRPNWWCPSCCKNFSNVDLVAAVEVISPQAYRELAVRLGELFTELINRSPFEKKSARQAEKSPVLPVKNQSEENLAPKNYSRAYETWRQKYSLKKFIDAQGGLWRGFDYEFLKSHGAIFNPEYMVGGGETAPVIILPYDDTFYFWREVGGSRRGVPKGSQRKNFYVASSIKGEWVTFDNGKRFVSCNIIFEGELDALSLRQAFIRENCKYFLEDTGIMATGSANFTQAQVESLIAEYGSAEDKPKFLIVFDNDKHGVDGSDRLVKILQAAGFYACAGYFGELGGKKIDANDILVKRGADALIRAVCDLIDAGRF